MAFALHTTSELWIIVSFQINRNYIAENLCINRFDNIPLCKGSCYLQKQLTSNENQQQKLPDLKTKDTVWFYQTPEIVIPNKETSLFCMTVYSPAKTGALLPAYLNVLLKPPAKLAFDFIDFV